MAKTKCTPARHASLAAHRKRQARYVAKNPRAQAARVKKSEAKHHDRVVARKRRAARSSSGTLTGKHSGPKGGRPREC